jgi:bacillolysin
MKRVMAMAVASGVLSVSLDVGLAQQTPVLRFNATSTADLRTWDAFVTTRERTGELRVRQVAQDPSLPSRTIERLQQYYQGVPVYAAEVVRDSDGGVPVSIYGELSAQPSVDTQPGLTADTASQLLLSRAGSGAALLKTTDLVVLRLATGEHRLAYTGVVSGGNQLHRVFIDAHSGAELERHSMIQRQSAIGTGRGVIGDTKKMSVALQGGTYVADDRLRPPVLTTFDMRANLSRALNVLFLGTPLFASDIAADADNDWQDVSAVDAHAYIGWTYDYYFKRHGRRGLDNRDRPLVSLINAITQQGALTTSPEFADFVLNAFWCGGCGPGGVGMMFFGNGIPPNFVLSDTGQTVSQLAGSLDIIAHELTHGVIDSSSGLLTGGEPGALNESIADIMGTGTEFFYQAPGSGRGQADYLIGEDSFRAGVPGSLNGIRSLANPQIFRDPDHYSIRYTGSEDDGGVHTNSAIPSHAFYLAVEGGRNRVSGLTVQGVGAANREQIEKVFYRAFVFLLPASASFSTARAATIQAARDLYGANSAAAQSVTQAWTAVGVN